MNHTLNLDGIKNLPVWKSAHRLFRILAIYLLVAEIIARTTLGSALPPPSVGADSFEFDIKVYYLEQSIRQRGSLDCLIVGDSMANDGPDPRSVEATYQATTGKTIHCFNFGMPALTLDASGPLAEALARRFQPRLLIFILSARDFDPTYGAVFRHVADSDWTRYNLGETSIRGWAVNSLYGYRYFLLFNYWLNPSNRVNFSNSWNNITPQGFTPLYGYGEPREISAAQHGFEMNFPSAQKGFDQLLQLKHEGVNLLIVDAPIRPELYLTQRDDLFNPYIESMNNIFSPLGIPFWLTRDLAQTIPNDAWYDYQHVNEKGVPVFSAWLGNQLAENYPPEFFR